MRCVSGEVSEWVSGLVRCVSGEVSEWVSGEVSGVHVMN